MYACTGWLCDVHINFCVLWVGGCVRCTFRSSYEDLDAPLMTAIQCTEPPSSDTNQARQVLLNDGRQFVLTTASVNNSDVSALSTSPSVVTASHAVQMQVTANPGNRPADDVELPNNLSLRDDAQPTDTGVVTDSIVPPCPVCQRSDFATTMEVTLHVNNDHPEVEDILS